jgi:hypothetical protein
MAAGLTTGNDYIDKYRRKDGRDGGEFVYFVTFGEVAGAVLGFPGLVAASGLLGFWASRGQRGDSAPDGN